MRNSSFWKVLGPGLLFAATAIGTSHLVLSTRAGAHYGMVYFWIILLALLLKYPFYEFAPRYTNATGHSLLKAYKDQGNWAVWLFLIVIGINMFAVVGAVGAVSAGILKTLLGLEGFSIHLVLGLVIGATILMLLLGGFSVLDNFVKLLSIVLCLAVTIAFVATLINGPVEIPADFTPPPLLDAAGLTLLIGLAGFMPNGMEASTMHSVWSVEKTKSSRYKPQLKEALLDFNVGYGFTALMAFMFLVIGALTIYGSGVRLDEASAMAFTNKLLGIFTQNLGEWSFYVLAIAAFGAIYGTLIAAWDAFARCFVRGVRILRYSQLDQSLSQEQFLNRGYLVVMPAIGIGGFFLFFFSAKSMVSMLDFATILAFIDGPIISFLNLRAVQRADFPVSHRPSKKLIVLAYIGLVAMVGFSLYYIWVKFLG